MSKVTQFFGILALLVAGLTACASTNTQSTEAQVASEASTTACDSCTKGKAGESVWCDGCNSGYHAGKKVGCKGCFKAKTEGANCGHCTKTPPVTEAGATEGEATEAAATEANAEKAPCSSKSN